MMSRAFDPSKFVNQEASERYTKLVSLKCIKKKGFFKPHGALRREILLKRWTELCKHPKVAIAPIVHEFYANMCGELDGTIFVLGKWVPFDKEVINAYYKLEEESYKEFQAPSIPTMSQSSNA